MKTSAPSEQIASLFRSIAGPFRRVLAATLAVALGAPLAARAHAAPYLQTGACCISGSCSILDSASCAAGGGVYQGDSTTCGGGYISPVLGATAVEDISSAMDATQLSLGDDGNSPSIALPFTFRFFGITQPNLVISANGWLTFDTAHLPTGSADYTPSVPLGNNFTAAPNNFVAAYWHDLNQSGSGKISYATRGVAPSRRFIVEWSNVALANNGGSHSTFEIVLNESSDAVELRYTLVSAASTSDTYAGIGLENAGGTAGVNIPFSSLILNPTLNTLPISYFIAPTDNPCNPIYATGACCNGAVCTTSLAAVCTAGGGAFQGTSVTCASTPCLPTGACCDASGACTVQNQPNCVATGGSSYTTNGSTCSGSPCPTGACCSNSGLCSILTSAGCSFMGGAYDGDGSTCAGIPCPTGACCASNGSCATVLASAAATLCTGNYLGNGSACGTITYPAPTSPANTLEDISLTGTIVPLSSPDDGDAAVALPFSFTFYGNARTGVRVGSNGYLSFGSSASTPANQDPIPDATTPNDGIYALWDDLHLRVVGQVFSETRGVAPYRRFIVQWNRVARFDDPAIQVLVYPEDTFQVILYETANAVEFRYGALNSTTPWTATVGLENSTGTLATQVPQSAVTGGNTALLFIPSGMTCPQPTGACCASAGCIVSSDADCLAAGGQYQGDGSACPATPGSLAASPPAVCTGASSQLSASVGPDETVDWFSDSCGGTLIASGSPLTVSPSATTTYFARARNTTTGCLGQCATVTVSVIPPAVAPDSAMASVVSFCANAPPPSIVLSASGGSGDTLEWHAGSCSGPLLGTGTPLMVPAPSFTTTYYALWSNTCGVSGCVSATVGVLPVPMVTGVGPDGTICSGSSYPLTGSVSAGDTLEWHVGSCSGAIAGLGSPLVVSPASTTTYYAVAHNTSTGCTGNCLPVVVNVNPTPAQAALGAGGTICSGDSFMLSGSPGDGETIDWYTGSCGGTLLGSGATLSVNPTTTTTYFGRARNTTTSCIAPSCGSVTVTVNPQPNTPTLGSVSAICSGSSATLTGSAGAGETIDWYAGSCGGAPVGSGLSISVSPTTNTTYFAKARNTTTGCVSAACASVTINVNNLPNTPTLGSVSAICSGSSATLTGSAGAGETIDWFSGSCGGAPAGSGLSISVSPTTTTTYFARARNTTTSCTSAACASVTVTVNPTPATPTVGAAGNICSGASFTLSATTSPGATIDWFTGSCGGSPVGSGLTLSVSPSTTTTYFARARDTTTSCTSAACASQTVNVTPTPTSPTAAGASTPSFCSATPPASITLSASGGSGGTLTWYTGSCGGGSPIGTGNSVTIAPPSSTTAYYVRSENGSCFSPSCAGATVTVNISPVAPASAAVNHPSFCDGVFPTITLTASGGSGDTLKWYSGSCGGSPVGSGASLTIPAPTSSTTYFARWESGSCGSTTCVSVNVHVDPSAHAPTAINASANNYCSGSVSSLTLTAVGGSGSTLQWFTGACGSSSIGTGNPLTIAAPTVTKTYFARWSNTTCGPSSCTSIVITVNPATGACCTGWGNQKTCSIVPPASCAGPTTPQHAYRGNCTTCSTNSCCPADYNNDGVLTAQDLLDYLADWFSNASTTDFDHSGTTDANDVFDFLTAFLSGC